MAYKPLAGLTYTPGTTSRGSGPKYFQPFGNVPSESSSGGNGSYTKADIQAAVARALAKSHPPGHHSAAGGLFSNLLGDVKDTVTGFVPGIIHTVEHPISTGEAIAQSYKQTYGPLVEGNFHKFLHNLYEHPLGPLLDAATVITAGGSTAVRGAALLERAGLISDESRLAKLTTGSTRAARINRGREGEELVPTGSYSQNPVIRVREKAFDKLANLAPEHTPFLGESVRATRAIKRLNESKLAGLEQVRNNYQHAHHALTSDMKDGGSEQTAFHHVMLGISPEERHHILQTEVDKGNHTIEHQAQQRLQAVRDAEHALVRHDELKDLTKGARSALYPKKFKARKVTEAELAAHAGEVAAHNQAIEVVKADIAKRRYILDKGANKVTRGTTRRHEVKLTQLAQELADKQAALKELKKAKPKDIPAHEKMVTHDVSKKALQTWKTQRAQLEQDARTAREAHDALQQTKLKVDPYNDHYLKDPKAREIFHETQRTHTLLKVHAGYETGERWSIERAIRDSELDEPKVGDKTHAEWEATHKALEKKLEEAGGSTPGLEEAIRKTEAATGRKLDPAALRILRTRDAAQKLSHIDSKIRKLGSSRARMRRYLHIGLHNGVRLLPNKIVTFTHQGDHAIGEVQEDGSIHLVRGQGERGKPVNLTPEEQKTVTAIEPRDAEKLLREAAPFERIKVNRDYYHADGAPREFERIQAAHDATGRAEPVYFPDKPAAAREGASKGIRRRGKRSGVPSPVQLKDYENENLLALAGAISSNPAVLTHHAIASIAAAHATDVAEAIRSHAYKVTRAAKDDELVLSGDSLDRGGLNKFIEQYQNEAAKAIKDQDIGKLQRDFIHTHLDSADKARAEGEKIVVSKKLVESMMPELKRSHNFMIKWYKDFSGIWKHMVLAGRPLPFIINNVVGNTIMYVLRHAGLRGLSSMVLGHNEERMFEEMLSEHHMTHGGLHQIERPNRFQKGLNFAYKTQGQHEHMLRRSTMVAEAKGDRLVQRQIKELRKDGPYRPELHDNRTELHEALRRADKLNPGVRQRIGNVVDDTLGNYRSFSRAEDQIRQLMPFYSWTRHSTRAYLKLLMDKPIAAVLVTQLGAVGKKEQEKILGDVPEFMRSYVPFHFLKHLGFGGKNNMAGIDTSVLNPEKTVADTINTIAGLTGGKAGENAAAITSNLNPVITSMIEQITGKSVLTQAPLKGGVGTSHGLLSVPLRIGEALPAARLIESALSPGSLGSSQASDTPGYTPTGKQKKKPEKTIENDLRAQGFDMAFGTPIKSWNPKGSKAWEQRIEGQNKSTEYHVAKKRKSKKKTNTGYSPLKGLTYQP